MLLPLIYFQISSCHKQILSSPRKKKNTEHPYGYSVQCKPFAVCLIQPFLNLTPLWRKGATAPLVRSTTLVFNEPPRSNFACLAGEPALRLGCASLSAPPLALRATVRWRQILSSPRKKEKYGTPLRVFRTVQTFFRLFNTAFFEPYSFVAQGRNSSLGA